MERKYGHGLNEVFLWQNFNTEDVSEESSEDEEDSSSSETSELEADGNLAEGNKQKKNRIRRF